MSKIHGRHVYVSLDASDISAHTNSVDFGREADSHDTTCFGQDSKSYSGGLLDGTVKLKGIYDSDATTGPSAVIEPLIGTVVPLVYRPEGTGTGKPEKDVNVLVTGYTETAPVADMITWQADCQMSGDITTSSQV